MTVLKGGYPSIHGRKLGISQGDAAVAKGGFIAGTGLAGTSENAGSVVLPGPQYWTLFDDFYSNGVSKTSFDTGVGGGPWHPNVGTDTGTQAAGTAGLDLASQKVGIRSTAHGGMAAITVSHNDSIATAGDGSTARHSLLGPMCASTNKGAVHMAARIKIDDTGTGKHTVFVGFTDDTGTAAEMAFYLDTGVSKAAANTAADLVATCTNGMGLLVSSVNGDTGLGGAVNKWLGVGADAGTVTTAPVALDTGLHPNDWQVVELLYDTDATDTGGSVYFAVNGKWFGQLTTGVPAKSATLAPVITLATQGAITAGQDTGSVRLDIDWISVSGLRDTGD